MDSVRKSVGVKDKDLKQVHYITSTIHKTDTLVLRDTIFRDSVDIDTVMKDAWYSVRLELKHPNYVRMTPKFKSSKYITVYTRKEVLNPKKCWL